MGHLSAQLGVGQGSLWAALHQLARPLARVPERLCLEYPQARLIIRAFRKVCLDRLHGRAPGFAALVPLFLLVLLRNRFGCQAPATLGSRYGSTAR
jgi:hypothetical protein